MCLWPVVWGGLRRERGLRTAPMQLHRHYRSEELFPPQHNEVSVGRCCFRNGGLVPLVPFVLLPSFSPDAQERAAAIPLRAGRLKRHATSP